MSFSLYVGNQDSLQRGLRQKSRRAGKPARRVPLETRTRFKEDCDSVTIPTYSSPWRSSVGNQDSLQRGLRPNRGSRATLSSTPPLETRTRFKEDCDPKAGSEQTPRLPVGNQDSLQRGLRHDDKVLFNTRLLVGNQDSLQRGLRRVFLQLSAVVVFWLETRTRFKEDCDSLLQSYPPPPSRGLETRTRFKEDCDD